MAIRPYLWIPHQVRNDKILFLAIKVEEGREETCNIRKYEK